MKKLKICGVSLCTLLAATGANAAGYTCEELIEYTSCSPGFYLKRNVCSDGSKPFDGCLVNGDFTEDEWDWCEDEQVGGEYYSDVCGIDGGAVQFATDLCFECPAGSTCSGGTANAVPCPAGSYCATARLIQPTGQCVQGTYSVAGAISCSTCPSTGLKDKDGATVMATTSGPGATSPSACVIGEEYYFMDAKGVYHFKSDCTLSEPWKMPVTTAEQCNNLQGFEWKLGHCYGPESGDELYVTTVYAPTTEEECAKLEATVWKDGKCATDIDAWWEFREDGLHCWYGD